MKVTVTKEHWDRGVEVAFPIMKRRMESRGQKEWVGDGYCETCVLAQAFKDAGFKDIMVNSNMAHLDGKRYLLSATAMIVLRTFDKFETLHRIKTYTGPRPYEEPSFPVDIEIYEAA